MVQLEGTRQPELERHVEPYRQADPAEVVDRHPATPHQVKDACQPAVSLLPHFEHRVRILTKEDERSDQRDEQALIGWIERNVEEDLTRSRCGGHSRATCRGFLWRGR